MDPRTTIKALFTEILSQVPSWKALSEEEFTTNIRRMERSCNNSAVNRSVDLGYTPSFSDKNFVAIYSECCSRLSMHFSPTSSINIDKVHPTYFADLLVSGNLDLNNICDLDSASMQPESNEAIRQHIEARRNVKDEMKVSKSFICRKCNGNETTFFRRQKNSIDEAETKYITCANENCGYNWQLTQ